MTLPTLVFRADPGAGETVARLAARGVLARAYPLFGVMTCDWALPEEQAATALAITSANGIRHAGPELASLRHLPVFAVGAATAQVAIRAGLAVTWTGSDDAAAVSEALAAAGHACFYHLCGADHVSLGPGSIPLVTYAMKAIYPSESLVQALGQEAVLLVHSPAAAHEIAAITDALAIDRARLDIVAISANAAAAAGKGWRSVAIAAKKDDEAVTDLVAHVCGVAGNKGMA